MKLAKKESKENASSAFKTSDHTAPSENENGNITSDDHLSFGLHQQ